MSYGFTSEKLFRQIYVGQSLDGPWNFSVCACSYYIYSVILQLLCQWINISECIEYHIYMHVILVGRAYEHIVLVHYRETNEVSL